jgi:PAS domain S-box-containing protein
MDGKITEANDTFLRMVGYTRDDLVSGRIDWLSMTPPEFRDLDEKSIEELASTGFNKTAFEKEYIRKDGTRIPVLIAGAMLDEKRSRGIAIVIDITERRKTEDALRESEEKYRTLFENMLEGFAYCRMIYDELQRPVDFIYLNVNRSFDRIIGAKTVTGKLVTEVFSGIREEYPQLFEIYGRVALTGQPESFDLDFRPSGKLLHISVYSPQKEFFVAIFEDITEVRRVEAELRESEQRLLLALDVSRMGIWELDLTLHSAHRTLRHDQIFGYQTLLPEWTYEMFLLHVIPEDRKDVDEKFNEAIAKQQIWSFECRIRRNDDVVRWIMAVGKGEYDPNGKPVRMLGIVQDITDRKQVEQQREILIKDLEQKNAELERFTYTVSHDLRSPLITIHGFTGLLESDIAGNNAPAIAHDLDRINAAATKMEELLHDLLNLSRIGRVVSPPEKISFTVLSQGAVDLLAGVISERKVQVIVDPDMPVVTVDPARVREAIMNLIENAVKFMGDQQYPEIRIGIEYNNNRPVFFVRDNGIGIDQKYFGKLFHLFEKLDAKKEGSGVGLAIVKRIIEVHGGRIWVESGGLGKGSTFRFTLPVL